MSGVFSKAAAAAAAGARSARGLLGALQSCEKAAQPVSEVLAAGPFGVNSVMFTAAERARAAQDVREAVRGWKASHR